MPRPRRNDNLPTFRPGLSRSIATLEDGKKVAKRPWRRGLPFMTAWLLTCLVVGWLAQPWQLVNSLPAVQGKSAEVQKVAAATIGSPSPTAEVALLTLPTLVPTAVPTDTPLPTATAIVLPTATPEPIATPTPEPTATPPPTATPLPTPTAEPTATPLPTATPEPTVTPIPAPTPTPAPANFNAAMQAALDKWKGPLGNNADYGLVIHDLDTDEKFAVNPQKLYPTASDYKLFVMLTVYYDISQGKLNLTDEITLTPAAADSDDDGGVLIVPIGGSMSVKDLLYAMITQSNNTAALMLMLQVGIPHMQQVVASAGFKETDLSDSYNFRTTPEDLDLFMTHLDQMKLLGPKYDPQMLDLLAHQQVRDRIPALLPADARVANKTGNVYDSVNDSGLVFLPNGKHFAISVLVRQADGNAARQFISQLSLAAYNYCLTDSHP